MKRIAQILMAAALVTTLAGVASADVRTPRIDHRRAVQHERIREGVKSGQLTPREARHLRAGQRHIARMERRMKRDGVVTARERMRIRRAQTRQSRHIYRLKHTGRSV